MDSIIELQRQNHAEIERFQSALIDLLATPAQNHKEELSNQHRAAQILNRIQSRYHTLDGQYKDQDGREKESELLSSSEQSDDLTQFYARLVKIKDHHRKYPDSVADGFQLELNGILEAGYRPDDGEAEVEIEDPVALLFSGEETYGRYLDLHGNHTAYNNIKYIKKRLTYLQYLDVLMNTSTSMLHGELSRESRLSKDYESYISALLAYLLSFVRRARPLEDVESNRATSEVEFIEQWDGGKLTQWFDNTDGSPSDKPAESIWCAACQKMYSKQTVYDAHLKSRKHIKATEKLVNSNEAPPVNPNGPAEPENNTSMQASTSRPKYFQAAMDTYLSAALLKSLEATLIDTKANVERRFALTARERELEEQEPQNSAPAPTNAAPEEEEEEERIYNPLKLPLGWDGKPIPYWLYKLHGLGVEYRCEICSDHIYMGRKNFERHFQESRHAFGMRALGLPNTKHFHEITRIEDALSLAEKLKQEGRKEISQIETTEELEDDEGNVYSRKTFDDLKKQGII